MSYPDDGGIREEAIEVREDLFLGNDINCAEAIIEEENLGVLCQSSRDRQALLLAPGEVNAPFPERCFKATRQASDVIGQARCFEKAVNLCIARRSIEEYVAADSFGKEKGALLDKSDDCAQFFVRVTPNIPSVKEDLALKQAFIASEYLEECCLATADCAGDADAGTRGYLDGESLDRRIRCVGVAELEVAYRKDSSALERGVHGVRSHSLKSWCGWGGQHCADAGETCATTLPL